MTPEKLKTALEVGEMTRTRRQLQIACDLTFAAPIFVAISAERLVYVSWKFVVVA